MSTCIFCEIAQHKEKAFLLFEDDDFLCFLDRRPLFPVHSLLIPKQHIATFSDLPNELIEPFFARAKRLEKAIRIAMNAEGSFVAMNNIVSQSVPHIHLHLVPRNKQDGLKGFFWPRRPYKDEAEMLDVQQKIREFL